MSSKRRVEPDAPAKRPVGRPSKKAKKNPAASETPKFTLILPPTTRKKASTSTSAAASTSATISASASDSETSSNVLLEIHSDSEMLLSDDEPGAADIAKAAVAMLGRGDGDYVDPKHNANGEEEDVDSDEEPEAQDEEEEEEEDLGTCTTISNTLVLSINLML